MDFQVIPRTFVFCTINNIMVVLLKTASVRVSFIQIMQVRVQNKGKSVWKRRYVGDVSLAKTTRAGKRLPAMSQGHVPGNGNFHHHPRGPAATAIHLDP